MPINWLDTTAVTNGTYNDLNSTSIITATEAMYVRQRPLNFEIEDGYLVVRDPFNNDILGKIKMIIPGQVNESELIDILEK